MTSSRGSLFGARVDVARFMVALAPNRPDLRRQLDAALAEAAGPLRQVKRPLELECVPRQGALL
jgi:hypothetical protein